MYEAATSKKRVIMVLGMARSGTSAIARGLKAIGVDLGQKLHKPDQRNPKGFWEDNDVNYKVNRGILRSLNYPWVCTQLEEHMRLQDNHLLNIMKRYAVNLVHDRLNGLACWGFKDTNNAVLLPFWQSVLQEAGVDDGYVIAIRNPLGCAYSNIKHSNLDLEAGLLAWLKNVILAVEGTHQRTRVVVSYDLLLNDPVSALHHLADGLKINIADENEVAEYASQFVDHKLHHHAYNEADLLTNPAMDAVPLCRRTYALMMQLAGDTLSFTDEAFVAEWRAIKSEFEHYYPLYNYANAVLKQNLQLERDIRAVNKSFFWRLLYPFRLIDDVLRMRRKSVRLAKRLVKAYG